MKSLDSKVKIDVLKGLSNKMRFDKQPKKDFIILAETKRKINPEYKPSKK